MKHKCRFSSLRRVSPAGGNSKNISVLVKSCSCGAIVAAYPERLTYFEKRWLQRVNKQYESENKDFSDWEYSVSRDVQQ